ncbi:DUF4974 domain-containing protein [Pseudoflavitalea sp. X16]|uniref:FecR domain-containing protein n=1 Tax=Paraflavitalea devenefica TaxID=2716334 RepID=UPI001421F43A|nr:FecR domain-containing protein [Paraflavitalea devenefica]NII27865.1 DUF4974 domain-containing protein [Paraflavitalea devenefica]
MNATNKNTMMDLISKYLAGEANAEEAMQLEDWLANPENAREFIRIRALWHQLPGAATPQTPSTQQAWSELEAMLPPGKKPAVVRLLFHRYAAAAIIGLLIILPFVWFNHSKEPRSQASNDPVYITQTTTGDIKTTTMPDGTTITINQHSAVKYTTGFNKYDRQVTLRGEAYFNVIPNKEHPFMISIADLTIKVVGTSFNVRDITPPGLIEVQVQSGVVKMYTTQKEIIVHKGQTGIYNQQAQELYVTDTLDINSIGYATKTFSFNDIALTDACRYLEKAFHVTIVPDAQKMAACRLSARFNDMPLDYILNVINATLNTTSSRQGDTIHITGNGCR